MTRIEDLFRAEPIVTDSAVVGIWRVVRLEPGSHDREPLALVEAVWRHPGEAPQTRRLRVPFDDVVAASVVVAARVMADGHPDDGALAHARAVARAQGLLAEAADLAAGLEPCRRARLRRGEFDEAWRQVSDGMRLSRSRHPEDDADARARRLLLMQAPAYEEFLRTVDPDLRRLVGDGVDVFWLARGWDGIVDDGPLTRALKIAPWAVIPLCDAWHEDRGRFEAKAAAGHLDTVVAEALRVRSGLPPAWAAGVAAAHAAAANPDPSVVDPERAGELRDDARNGKVVGRVRLARGLPGNWIPTDRKSWTAYLDLCRILGRIAHHRDGAEALRTFVDARGDWIAYRERVLAAACARDVAGADAVFDDADDVCEAYGRQVIIPALALAVGAAEDADVSGLVDDDRECSSTAHDLGYAMLRNGQTLVRGLARSRAWHADRTRMEARVAAWGDGAASLRLWPKGLPDHEEGDLTLTVLADQDSLGAEGAVGLDADGVAGLDHCVAGYAGRCAREGVRIASVRRVQPNGEWERLATAELTFRDGGLGVLQLRGCSNAEPLPEVEAFVHRYAALVDRGALEVDDEGLAARAGGGSVSDECGYTWWRDGLWEAVRDLWRPYVPTHLRDVTPEVLLAAYRHLRDAGSHLATDWGGEPFRLPDPDDPLQSPPGP